MIDLNLNHGNLSLTLTKRYNDNFTFVLKNILILTIGFFIINKHQKIIKFSNYGSNLYHSHFDFKSGTKFNYSDVDLGLNGKKMLTELKSGTQDLTAEMDELGSVLINQPKPRKFSEINKSMKRKKKHG